MLSVSAVGFEPTGRGFHPGGFRARSISRSGTRSINNSRRINGGLTMEKNSGISKENVPDMTAKEVNFKYLYLLNLLYPSLFM